LYTPNRFVFFFRDGLNLSVRSLCWVRAAALLGLCPVATVAWGENWFFQPLVTVGSGYEENVDLEPDGSVNTTQFNVGVSVRGGLVTERSQVVGTLLSSFNRSPGNERLDSDNLSAEITYDVEATERDQLNLDVSLNLNTSGSSELTTTGNISENVPLLTIGLETGWQHQLTERSTFGLGYARSGGRFDDNASGLVDSQQDDVDVSYSYALTEQLDFGGAVGATFYNPDGDESYKTYDASLSMRYALSETLGGNLGFGWQRIDRDTDLGTGTARAEASGTVYGFNLSKIFERSSLGLSVRRGAVPTGSGVPLLQESLILTYSYQFSPRLSVTTPVGVFRNETISFGDAGETKDRRIFFQMQPSLNWRVREDVVLSASYRYQYQRFEEEGTSADGNAVFLSLAYIWPTEIR